MGSTSDLLIFQDINCLTPNILCQTIETVSGGGAIFMLVDKLSNLEQLYNLTMSVHQKYKTDAFQEVTPIFNERMFLSLS